MASSLFVNTLQVDFASVLTIEHTGMVRMFKSLEDTGLRGFLEGTTYVFENVVTEFFANAKVIAGTICSRKLVIMEDMYSATFKLPTEGMTSLGGIPKETIAEMRRRFSATDMPFKTSSKKREMLFEYRLLHDIVAKSLCAKVGSFDTVTCEKFEFMVAIDAGLSVNWERILFQRLFSMVHNPKKQSQGYTVPIIIVMETLVKADLGASIKLHSQKVLMSKSVQSYIKKNQHIIPEGETSKYTEDTASKTEVSRSHLEEPVVPESLAIVNEKGVKTSKKRKQMGGGQKKQTKRVTKPATQTVERQSVEYRRLLAPTNFDSEEVSEPDSCPLVTRRCWRKQVSESLDSESTISLPLKDFGEFDDEHLATGSKEPEKADHEQDAQMGIDFQTENQGCETQLGFMNPADKVSNDIRNELASVEEHCQLLITTAWDNVSTRMTIFEEWLHFRKEVRIKDISSFEPFVTIEEQFLEWGETEEVSDLFERRSLIMYKVLELELEKLYHEHLANFKLDVPFVNHDFLCTRRLHKELRMIAVVHRDHRVMEGLSLANHEQGAALSRSHQTNQQAAEDMAMTSHEHQAQDNESPVQTYRHQSEGNEHQDQDEHGSISGPSQLGGRHSNPVVTTPTIALDLSGATQQSASPNVAPNQIPPGFTHTAGHFLEAEIQKLTLAAERSHRLNSKSSNSSSFAFPLPAQLRRLKRVAN
ncbi:hypothetical protein F511_08726 [Dorcoceras hygrometricum]|uniref:Uncharacterized protein n=1 Tax=Dorcoceras hygrometricum TaxID=472368 RepID=A0A2Z7AAF9_9LAMI|nr:hypothetical protein F511_08726 [Dorcoceras hygrometricum]